MAEIVASNIGRNITPEQLTNAFEASFGEGSSRALTLVCTERNGRPLLAEIRIALETTSVQGSLKRDDLYLDGEPDPGTCPDTIRVDPAGQ
jgi:ribonuclease T2